ncbi:uncharacterized protein LOC144712962 isoform X2 [Wolffia australiana]
MDWPWQMKCGSAWTPSESPSLSRPPLDVVEQMEAHPQIKFSPFVPWEGTSGDRSFDQDPRGFSNLNSFSCASSKKDLGISFQALPSGHCPTIRAHLSSNSRFQAVSVGSSGDSSNSVFAPYLAVSSGSHPDDSMTKNTENSLSTSNNFLGSGSQFPIFSAGKPVGLKSHVDSERVSSVPLPCSWGESQTRPANIFPRQVEAVEFKSDRMSFIRGCPRVFCLGKVGELFVSDDGLLGVYCFCHNLRMSVAKFCEHSGLFVVNPGDAVILENGETVAQWRRLFFQNLGVTIPEDASVWEWGTGASVSGRFSRSDVDTLPSYKNSVELRLGQPSQQNRQLSTLTTLGNIQPSVETEPEKEQNYSIRSGYAKSRLSHKPTQEANFAPSEISSSTMNEIRHYTHNYAEHAARNPELVMARPGADCGAVMSFLQSHLGASGGKPMAIAEENTASGRKPMERTKESTTFKKDVYGPDKTDFSPPSGICSVANDSTNTAMINEINSKMYVSQVPDHKEIGKKPTVTPDDEIYVMTHSTAVEIKSKRQLRTRDKSRNLITYEDGKTNNNCFDQSNSRASTGNELASSRESSLASKVLISENGDDSVLWLRTARSSTSASPKRNFLLSNTKNTIPETYLSNHVDLNNFTQLESNNGSLATSQGMNTRKFLFFPSKQTFIRTNNGDLGSSERFDSGTNLGFTQDQANNILGSFQSYCKLGSSDHAENISAGTVLSGSEYRCQQSSGIQDLSLRSSEPPADSPATHVYENEEKPISRVKKTHGKILGSEEGRIPDQREEMLIHARSAKNYCRLLPSVRQKILPNPRRECITRSKIHKLVASGQRHESRSGHDGDVPVNRFANSDLITSNYVDKALSSVGNIHSQITSPADKNSDSKFVPIVSSEEEFHNTNSQCNAHLVALAEDDCNNLDSSTGGFRDLKSLRGPALDEGSAVEKCGSSDDVVEHAERSNNASCSALRFMPNDEHDHDSSVLKFHKCFLNNKQLPRRKRKQGHIESIRDSGHGPEEDRNKAEADKKKKKVPKWKRLGDSFQASCSFKLVSPSCNSYMELKSSSEGAEFSVLVRTQDKTEGFKHKRSLFHRYRRPCNSGRIGIVEGDSLKKTSTSLSAEGKRKRTFKACDKEGKMQDANTLDEIHRRDILLRPVVRGNSGIIFDRSMDGKSKPVKFASLLMINKRCDIKWERTEGFENFESKKNGKPNQKKENGKRKFVDFKRRSKADKQAACVQNLGDKQAGCIHSNRKRKAAVHSARGCTRGKTKKKKKLALGDRRDPTKFCPADSTKECDADVFCCVCGSYKKENDNSLLECRSCFIKLHQACYGITKIPKGRWSCRPCRRNLKDIACVLCGYEGGAMTRALRTRNIVKSLLRAWKDGEGCKSLDQKRLFADGGALSEMHNSITAGDHDPSVLQWVHVVCGLWTPGTRCPNVATMNAFDVSGVLPSARRMVCAICNRPGGSTIKCRVEDCSVHFHPWCAHQKGLLQSETEGIDDENVGFYGRCLLHATHHIYQPEMESPCVMEFSCARIEGFKGRERGYSFLVTQNPLSEVGKSIVPAELLKKWILVDGQKSCQNKPENPVSAKAEHDCRKYTRYKRMMGWKHLTVYKSRIHGLGLYTCKFIPRGEMVVEYVGEIVGLRVADKRELEYQSGKKLQYKSACYFFRIDKDTIIDATRKGGIARFVNHSCLPNCVAKVIALRNAKKVVFFAERDIKPGEEITYDYNFNHEEEGKKIPCFCRSKNCRRYLN